MEKLDLTEPTKTKRWFIEIFDLTFKEGGSYLWIIFFILICGIFFDIGFYTIPISESSYKYLVLLFGLLLSTGMILHIVKYEPESQRQQINFNNKIKEHNTKLEEYEKDQESDLLKIEKSLNDFIIQLERYNIWQKCREVDAENKILEYYGKHRTAIRNFKERYFSESKPNLHVNKGEQKNATS